MSLTQALHQTHLTSFAGYNSGEISFSDCWSQQRNVLDKLEQIIKDEISQLERLTVPKEKLQSDIVQKDLEIENEEHKKSSSDDTWSIGILSNFIEKNEGKEEKSDHRNSLEDVQKTEKEAFKNVLQNLRSKNSKKKENQIRPLVKGSSKHRPANRLQQPGTVRKKENVESGKSSFDCPECNFKSSIFWNLKVHLGTHIGAVFQCTICEEEHKRKFNLMEHIRHSHQEKREITNRKWVDSYIVCHCESCDITGTVKEYDQHLHRQHNLPLPSNKQHGPFLSHNKY